MSHRSPEAKQRRRVAKKLTRRALPAYFDLVTWLVDNGHARTKPEAKRIILDKKVKHESHTLGVDKVPNFQFVKGEIKMKEIEVLRRHVSTAVDRASIVVLKSTKVTV